MSKRHPSRSAERLIPPTTESASRTIAALPALANWYAAVNPAGPAPMTTTSSARPVCLLLKCSPRLFYSSLREPVKRLILECDGRIVSHPDLAVPLGGEPVQQLAALVLGARVVGVLHEPQVMARRQAQHPLGELLDVGVLDRLLVVDPVDPL